MLRAGLLTGRTVALVGAGAAVTARLDGLGATIPAPPDHVADALVVDAGSAFAAAGGGYDGLRAAVDGAFAAARDHAVAHWIDAVLDGKVVVLAPAPGAGPHAGAARAGLENLVRTLATEWARHGVTTVAVLPGDTTSEDDVADLVAWLVSPAGAYLTGTALTLDG